MSISSKRIFGFAAVVFGILISAIAVAHTDGIYNRSANSVGDTQGIDSAVSSGVAALACSYTPVTTGTQNVAYTGATPAASGGVLAYTFSETGSLPTGLTISSVTGVISGTPSVSGSFTNIQVKVTDAALTVANCGTAFTLVIAPNPPVVSFVAAVSATNSGSTFTTSTANIGNPAYIATRRVIVFIVGGGSGVTLVSGVINGVAADTVTTLGTGGNLDGTWIMSAVVPSGTTSITVTSTMSGAVFGAASFCIYNVDNGLLNSPTPVAGYVENLSATTGTATANSLSGGFILSGQAGSSGISGSSITAASETYTLDALNVNASGRNSCAHVNGVAANTPSSVTWSWTTATNNGTSIAAFR